MRFLVPDWVHGGDLSDRDAQRHWRRLCREVSKHYGEPLATPAYRVRYVRAGEKMQAASARRTDSAQAS
jgi:hypothetical protein